MLFWNRTRIGMLVALLATCLLQGCSSLIAYHPKISSSEQNLRFAQGVGTLSERDAEHELYIYPTYKVQGPTQPTFTIGYANNSSQPQDFSVNNVKAFFNGGPVPLYTYSARIEEIRQEKIGKQVGLAILGGALAVAAANTASRQTYTSNYSGGVRGPFGATRFSGSNTLRVYDPGSGLFAAAAVGGVTGLGISQVEYNALNQEAAAEAILQANTVDPQRMVAGQLMIKGCCDMYGGGAGTLRFEVTANGRTSVFEFLRLPATAAPPPQTTNLAGSPPAPYVPVVAPPTILIAQQVPPVMTQPVVSPVIVPTAPTQLQPAPVPAVAPVARAPAPPAMKGGQDAWQAEHLPEVRSCLAQPIGTLVGRGPGFESYSFTCVSGDVLLVRCEFGNCRVLK